MNTLFLGIVIFLIVLAVSDLVSRWEHTSPSIDMNCHVKEKNVFCYAVADQKDMIEVLSMKVRVDKDVVATTNHSFAELTIRNPAKDNICRVLSSSSVLAKASGKAERTS